jgi:hypothetical protein
MWKGRADDAQSCMDTNHDKDGRAVYALRQADVRELMLAQCREVWVKAYELLW